ncbi:MAG: hypothetical protein AAGE52_26160 [Myxococcota bacterium]
MRLLLSLLALFGCGSKAAVDRSPGEPPPGVLATVELHGGADLFRDLNAELEGSFWEGLYETPSALFSDILSIPADVHPRPTSTITLAIFDNNRVAAVFKTAPVEGRAGEGPRGSTLHAQSSTVALDGTTAVAASTPELLAEVFPWLAYGLPSEEKPRGIYAEVSGDLLARGGRRVASFVEDLSRDALINIRRERARHDEAPTLGEPEAVVRWGTARAEWLTEMTLDAEHADVQIRPDPRGLRAEATLYFAADSAFATWSTTQAAVPVPPDLPERTAVVAWQAASTTPWLTELVLGAGAGRIEDDIAESLRDARETRPLLALGTQDQAWWALFGGINANHQEFGQQLLATSYAQTLVAHVLDCSAVDLPESLCGEARLWSYDDEGEYAYVISSDATEVRRAGLRGVPQAARVLPEEAAGLLFLDPPMIAALPWVRDTGATNERAPLCLSWSADTQHSVTFRLAANRHGLAHLTQLVPAGR